MLVLLDRHSTPARYDDLEQRLAAAPAFAQAVIDVDGS